MSDSIHDVDTDTLRHQCLDVLRWSCDIQECSVDAAVIRDLLTAKDLTQEFELLMQTGRRIAGKILCAALWALVNAQSVLAIEAELARRAAPNNWGGLTRSII